MADLFLAEQSVPATPAAGNGVLYIDSTTSLPASKDDAGRSILLGGGSFNCSIADQTVNAADTYLLDSSLLIPSFGLQARTNFIWLVSASKTAAGVATPIYNIRIGALKTTGDTARLALTGPAQTAVADIGTLMVMVTVRTVAAGGVIQGTAYWGHRGTAASTTVSGTGFANDVTGHVQGTSAGFDNSAMAGLYIGLSTNSGASGVWTVTQVRAEAMW